MYVVFLTVNLTVLGLYSMTHHLELGRRAGSVRRSAGRCRWPPISRGWGGGGTGPPCPPAPPAPPAAWGCL